MLLSAQLTGCALPHVRVLTDPLTPAEHLDLGVSYERNGELEPALRQYELAAKGPLKGRSLTNQGNIYFAQKNSAKAERRYREALAVEPDQLEALNNLAWLLAKENRSLDEAERLIRQALTQNPEPRQDYENTLQAVLDARKE